MSDCCGGCRSGSVTLVLLAARPCPRRPRPGRAVSGGLPWACRAPGRRHTGIFHSHRHFLRLGRAQLPPSWRFPSFSISIAGTGTLFFCRRRARGGCWRCWGWDTTRALREGRGKGEHGNLQPWGGREGKDRAEPPERGGARLGPGHRTSTQNPTEPPSSPGMGLRCGASPAQASAPISSPRGQMSLLPPKRHRHGQSRRRQLRDGSECLRAADSIAPLPTVPQLPHVPPVSPLPSCHRCFSIKKCLI